MKKNAWALLAMLLTGPMAHAMVTRFTVDESSPYGRFNGVEYVRVKATVEGALAPTERIADIDKAPRNAEGRVTYTTKVVLVAPREAQRGNGALVIDVPNRGLPIAHALYNSPRARPLMLGSLDAGTGFLENRGFATAAVTWELGEGIELPAFTDAEGKQRYVEGIGFAAVRDVALFLRGAGKAQGNPLAGAVRQVYGVGYSQTARFLKSFLQLGFNQADDRRVFDGVHLFAAAAGLIPLNRSGTGPKSVSGGTPGYSNADLRGVHEEPYTYGDLVDSIKAMGQTPPNIVVAHTSTDYHTGRASLTRTGAKGTTDLPLPPNVRMYDIAGAGHLNIRQQDPSCTMPHAQLDWTPPLRAMLANLHAWTTGAAQPPASRLMALEPRADDPQILPPAPHMQGATILVPRSDPDGNPASGGVRTPDVAVPLGTNGAANQPNSKSVCRLAGTFQAFASTAATRAAGDTRLSLQERYPGGLNDYVDKVRNAAAQLVNERLLLPEDAAVLVEAAAVQPLFPPTAVPEIFR
jgi:hypothetical protein